MPRPLNLIIGEGTVKNQRMGGLGALTDSQASDLLNPISMSAPLDSSPYMDTPDFSTPLVPYSSSGSSSGGVGGNNWLILGLLGAGVVFMVLAKGRR